MENSNKELDKLAKLIVDRAEKMNQGEGGTGIYKESVDRVNIKSAEALAIITKTKALISVIESFGKKERPVIDE